MQPGSMEHVFKEYAQFVLKKVAQSNPNKNWWPQGFERCQSDFERVLCLFKLIRPDSSVQLATLICELPTTNPISDGWSRKNDVNAIKMLAAGNARWEEKKGNQALHFFTISLFLAESKLQQSLALDARSCILFHLKCFTESAEDINLAFKLDIPKERAARLHVRLGRCLLYLHDFEMATHHFKQANRLLAEFPDEELLDLATSGLKDSRAGHGKDHELAWRCEQTIVEPLKITKKKRKGRKGGRRASGAETKLIAAGSNPSIRLRDGGPAKGWFMETTRDVQPGETLLVDSPYASRLTKENFATHCYHCYRRSLNLKPCNGCTLIGFCSDICRKKACELPSKGAECPRSGLGHHGFECGSLSCLLMDNYAGWPKQPSGLKEPSIGGKNVAHLAFACISDTHPDLLLDYLCGVNTDPIKFCGRRPFVGQSVRRNPPSVINPHDYNSVEWLIANSEHRSVADLWQRTVAAVFLTYCLHVGGYPMCWMEDAHTENLPSPSNRPKVAPARWIAACILNHLQTVSSNAHTYNEALSSTKSAGRLSLPTTSVHSIAACLYSTLSLINHSCDPNVSRSSCSAGRCLLVSLRCLPAGTELLDCYATHYFIQCRDERQAELNDQYHFKCACVACKQDWPRCAPVLYKCPSCGPVASCRCTECQLRLMHLQMKALSYETVMAKVKALTLANVAPNVVETELAECFKLLGDKNDGFEGFFVRPGQLWDWLQELCKMLLVVKSGNWSVLPNDI